MENSNSYLVLAAGGSGMNVVVQYLLSQNKVVYGSDRSFDNKKAGRILNILEKEGLKVIPENSFPEEHNIDLLIKSPAIEDSHPSVIRARMKNIPVITRSEFVTQLYNKSAGVGIAGTSGKSTVTGMLGYILSYSTNKRPSIFSGAELLNFSNENTLGNFIKGDTESILLEIDESDGVLKNYKSFLSCITSVDKDHYTLNELYKMFSNFASHSKNIIINEDKVNIDKLNLQDKSVYTLSAINTKSDFYYKVISSAPEKQLFSIRGELAELKIPGEYNIENAAMAISMAYMYGIPLKESIKRIKEFSGVKNRFELTIKKNNYYVLDFAHNPEKVEHSILSAQKLGKPVIYCFQPHGYGPLKFLFKDYLQILNKNIRNEDKIILLKVFDAGGTADRTVQSDKLINSLNNSINKFYFSDKNDLISFIKKENPDNTTIVVSGARDNSLRDLLNSIKNN